MRRLLFVLAVSFLFLNISHAAKPSDFSLKEGDLISASDSGDPDVFIVNEHGYKRLFLNPVIFNYYGHLGGFKNVKKSSVQTRDVFPTTGYYRNCEANDPRVYTLKLTDQNEAVLQWVNVPGSQVISEDPDFFKKVFCINNKEFSWYKKSTPIISTKEVQAYDRAKRWGLSLTKICHHASENPDNWHAIEVADPSLIPAHLEHGDTLGTCLASTSVPSPGSSVILEDGFYNFYETARVNKISTILKLTYPNDQNSKATAFELYKKFPDDSGYSLAANFQNIDTTACNGSSITNEWILTQSTSNCNMWVIVKVKPGSTTTLYGTADFSPSSYSSGEYKFYVVVLDSAGREILSSNVQTIEYFNPVEIIYPVSSQPPLSNLNFQWKVPDNWPTKCCYSVVVFDKPATSGIPVWSHYANVTPGLNAKVYDGPTLDSSKTYTVSIFGIGHSSDYASYYWAYPEKPIEFRVTP